MCVAYLKCILCRRSLVTKLDAANHFTPSHLEPNWDVVERAKIFYSAGFFLTVSVDSMLRVAKHAVETEGKVFSMNLSAPFLSEFFADNLNKVLEFTELLFGNEQEAVAFAKMKGWTEEEKSKDVAAIAKKVARECKFSGREGSKGRTVVFTQGADEVVVVEGKEAEPKKFAVPKLAADKIVDTNGAGDAFVGGYLAQLALGADLETRVRCGNWAAQVIIQRSGCTFPEKMEFQ